MISRKTFLNISLMLSLAATMVSAADEDVVRSILDLNNKKDWDIASIATYENGRLVQLNLNNQNIATDGLNQLPAEMAQLSELRVLTLDDNDFHQLPKELFECKNLKVLQIRDNAISSLPAGISNLTALEVLDLRNNQLTELPGEIGSLKSITKIHLWGNDLTTLPTEIGSATTLQELYLNNNKLTDLPVSITKLSIKYLDIYDNELCAVSPAIDKWLKKYDAKYKLVQKCVGEKRFK